jgi:hypothetical protein
MKRVLFWIILFGTACFPFGYSLAAPYHPDQAIRVHTEVSGDGDDSRETSRMAWTVLPRKNSDGSVTLSYTIEADAQPLCRIRTAGSRAGIQWEEGVKGPDILRNEELLIAPGYPAPCDLLPVAKLMDDTGKTLKFEIKRRAGGATLADSVVVDIIPVKMDDAKASGWVPLDFSDFQDGDSLWLVRAINMRSNTFLVQQLWLSTGSWWIYEETPYRRSWQMR